MNKEEIEELVEFLYKEPEIKVLSKEEKNILYLENLYNQLTFENIDLQQENKQLKEEINKMSKKEVKVRDMLYSIENGTLTRERLMQIEEVLFEIGDANNE